MTTTIAVTQHWQVHIPKKVREAVGLKKPGRLTLKVEDDKIILSPQDSVILKLAGKYVNQKANKKINLDKIRDQIDYSRL